MAEFVQIGDEAFNPAWISYVRFYTNGQKRVAVWFIGDEECMEFAGSSYDAFLDWWERHAIVRVMP